MSEHRIWASQEQLYCPSFDQEVKASASFTIVVTLVVGVLLGALAALYGQHLWVRVPCGVGVVLFSIWNARQWEKNYVSSR